MKRAVVTGAAGSVGVALIKELQANGVEVLALCREGSARNGGVPKSPRVTLKYCSLDKLADLRNDTGKDYDVFYHFAWEGTTGASRDDMHLQNRNVKHSLDAVDAAKRLGCHTFIGAGSQAEYGRFEGTLKPDTPAFPENGYGIAKLCAGRMTREYAKRLGMKHIWVRILSVYDARDIGGLVVPTIKKLRNGEVPEFTKGEQMWDYLYGGDAAKAFYLLGDRGHGGKVYVLGSGQTRPLAEYITEIRDAVAPGAEIKLGAIPYADRQVMHLCADISELRKDTGWLPLATDFARTVEQICRVQIGLPDLKRGEQSS